MGTAGNGRRKKMKGKLIRGAEAEEPDGWFSKGTIKMRQCSTLSPKRRLIPRSMSKY